MHYTLYRLVKYFAIAVPLNTASLAVVQCTRDTYTLYTVHCTTTRVHVCASIERVCQEGIRNPFTLNKILQII